MITLTDKTIDGWDVGGGLTFSKLMAHFVQEKQGHAGPATFALLPLILISVCALIGGPFERSWALGLSGAAGLGGVFGLIFLMSKLAKPYLSTLSESIESYLASLPSERVIQQAVSLGPSYRGRQYLLRHLDNRDALWSERHLDELVRLVRAEELPANQRSHIRWYLSERHPGWSGGGKPLDHEIQA